MSCFIRVSAIWEDGTSVDNDKVNVTGLNDADMQTVINDEIKSAKKWFAGRNPKGYLVSIYNGDRCVNVYETDGCSAV